MSSTGPDVRLRPVEPDDMPVFFEHQRDPEATRMANFAGRERDAFMAHWTKILADPTMAARTILVDGAVAGNIGSWGEPVAREVGYWIGREHWGRGVATAALTAFLDVEPQRPLWAHVAKHNVGSIKVLERCGFAFAETDANSPVVPDSADAVVLRLEANDRS